MTFWRWPQATTKVFHSAVAYMFVPSFVATAKMTLDGGLPVPHLDTAEMTFGGGRQKFFPVLNLFLPNMEVFLHLNVVPRVSIHIYD